MDPPPPTWALETTAVISTSAVEVSSVVTLVMKTPERHEKGPYPFFGSGASKKGAPFRPSCRGTLRARPTGCQTILSFCARFGVRNVPALLAKNLGSARRRWFRHAKHSRGAFGPDAIITLELCERAHSPGMGDRGGSRRGG